jgi:hypothetical protein
VANISRINYPLDSIEVNRLKEFYYLTQNNTENVTENIADTVTNLISSNLLNKANELDKIINGNSTLDEEIFDLSNLAMLMQVSRYKFFNQVTTTLT